MNARTPLPDLLHNDPFFQVPRQRVSTSEGPVDLPILYYDTTAVNAFFLADRERVAAVLKGTALEPALTFGDKALVALACFEYRDTSVGMYNEVGLAVAATRLGEAQALGGWRDLLATLRQPEERHVAFHILDLPVTTAAANAAGREIWGYPKFVTEIPFSLQGRHFDCSVRLPQGGCLMQLTGNMGPSLPTAPLGLALLSLKDGDMVRATVNVRGATRLALPGNLRLRVHDREHAMAKHLHALGLDGARPFAVTWTDQFQSRLNGGVAV